MQNGGMDELQIQTERVDDIPLLMAQQRKMGLTQVVNEAMSVHGNRQGLSVGDLLATWLSFILSEGDHRMMAVEEWAAARLVLLAELTNTEVTSKDFTDDRLADVLRMLSDDESWAAIEARLGQRIVQVYDLGAKPVRLDSTTVAVHHEAEGLFQYGYSKDRRPDLVQFKVMLGTLDPLGMPLATLVPAGNEADDGLYLPTIERVRRIVGQGGQLYVGDSKMSALATRAALAQAGDYYLMPLPRRQQGPDELSGWLMPVSGGDQSLTQVWLERDDEEKTLWALGYEQERERSLDEVSWSERVLVIFRPALARQERANLAKRLAKAEAELRKLTPRRPRTAPKFASQAELEATAQVILKQYQVDGLLQVTCTRTVEERTIRCYGDRPARTEVCYRETVQVQRDAAAIRQVRQQLGWRLYVTNAPDQRLPLELAVLTYRDAPRIELAFRRLKGRSLGIRPIYTHRDDHTTGLVRLLSLALRVLTLTEFVVRERLREAKEALAGLYPGQPTRQTDQPTTERLLRVFKGLNLSLVRFGGQQMCHITPLSSLQQRILELLGLSDTIYSRLATADASIPP